MKIKIYSFDGINISPNWGNTALPWEVVKQSPSREWLDDTGTKETNTKGYGNKCLPLKIGNQLGWNVLFPTDVICYYDSKKAYEVQDALSVKVSDKRYAHFFRSHFGTGILTCTPPLMFQTKRNRQLYVRGATNYYKEGVMFMDAVIETDWMNFKFTYNIKILKKDCEIIFKKGEPMFSFIPINLEEIDKSYIVTPPLYKNPLFAFFSLLYGEKRIATSELYGSTYASAYNISLNKRFDSEKKSGANISKEELKKTIDSHKIDNFEPYYWMKDYFFGGWDSLNKAKKTSYHGDLMAPEIGCPYLHFLNLKREKRKLIIKNIFIKPFKLIRFYLFRNMIYYKLFLRNKILKKNKLTEICLLKIKKYMPENIFKKIIGNYLNK